MVQPILQSCFEINFTLGLSRKKLVGYVRQLSFTITNIWANQRIKNKRLANCSGAGREGFSAEAARRRKWKKKQTFCKFTYLGVDLDQLLDVSYVQLMQLYSAYQRQQLNPGLHGKEHSCWRACARPKKRGKPWRNHRRWRHTWGTCSFCPRWWGT